jgi:hypothetical protein
MKFSSRLPIFALLLVVAASANAACGGSSSTGPSEPAIPNYAGNYSGTYTITGCNQSGGVALANVCGNLGSAAPYSFSFQQSSRSVTGSFFLGSVSFPNVGGTIGSDGSLGLNGTSITNGVTVVVTWALRNSGTISGTITQVWQSNTLSGQANVVGTISTANRTSSLPLGTFAVPTTLNDLSFAMSGR